jgi:hypothetical protein
MAAAIFKGWPTLCVSQCVCVGGGGNHTCIHIPVYQYKMQVELLYIVSIVKDIYN